MKHILLIATGGTIASKATENGLTPQISSEEMLDYVPAAREFSTIDAVQILNIDSTNIQPEHWLLMARTVKENYDRYDGFVICHGTDTMAYTSAALSYLIQNSPKPIIITGAQKPISMEITDAKTNLLDSLRFAACDDAHGVSIVFNGKVIAGTRARKVHSKSFNAFDSINFPVLATIRDNRIVHYVKESCPCSYPAFYIDLNPKVFLLKLIPGMDPGLLPWIGEHYDAVIIGHSQFEKIPMSLERQRAILQQQLDEVLDGISELKKNRGDNFSIKQLERTKKTVKQKLDKLNDQSRKDDVVTFEELGVDRIFIDEAHYYKNLAAFTKMRNVGNISQTEAMKSSDLYMKCRYLDELSGGRGVVFATGTPISNSMVEMYTMQKYLQYGALRRNDLLHFDAWASTFGETVTAIELSPEGTGYRAKTRFAKFYNLPELMAMFKETADIQTADMLKLPVPEAHYHSVVLKPSETQKEMVASLSERAERVRNKMVDSSVDNMLLITNDGRKLALDQRLMNDMLPDSETSKVGACAENVFDIWQRTADRKSTQMVFCDLSTPHGDGKFNVYDDLRNKLIAKGIPAEEIVYIHAANSEAQKKELFGKVRSGQVRVLIGSTQKMGAGTNVQTKLAALHHLDCPWRPSDLQQREGRIIRQGNENKEVDIYTYVTENTFDSYLYQLVESKQKFIGQIMTSKSPVRSAEDIDETALSYAEIKALCAGNPHIKEKMDLDIDVSRLKLLKANHLSQRYALEDQILKEFPQKIKSLEQRIEGYQADIDQLKRNTEPNEDGFSPMIMPGGTVREKKAAGDAILGLCKSMTSPDPIPIGQYRGFDMELSFDTFSREYKITLIHQLRHTVTLGSDVFGNIQRLDNTLGAFEERMAACADQLENTRVQLENAKAEVQKPFPQEEELKTKSARLNELNAMLNLDKRENEIVDGERADEEPSRSSDDRER